MAPGSWLFGASTPRSVACSLRTFLGTSYPTSLCLHFHSCRMAAGDGEWRGGNPCLVEQLRYQGQLECLWHIVARAHYAHCHFPTNCSVCPQMQEAEWISRNPEDCELLESGDRISLCILRSKPSAKDMMDTRTWSWSRPRTTADLLLVRRWGSEENYSRLCFTRA